MSGTATYKAGDVVVHPKRREWGDGVVEKATSTTHNGNKGQRLTVRFENKGRVTINTAAAPLISKDVVTTMSSTTTSSQGWLASLEGQRKEQELWALPDALTDPFSSSARRLSATLDTYRFSLKNPRDILDWACEQTGMADPLTKYTRPELEQAFPRFARDRDQHLFELVRQMKHGGESAELEEARRTHRVPAARDALARAMRR